MEVILVGDDLDQFQRHNKRQNHSGDGDNDRLRKVVDHVIDAAIPALGGHTHLAGDFSHLLIDGIEHPGQVARDTAHQKLLEPFGYGIPQKIHRGLPSFLPLPHRAGGAGVLG